MQCIQDVQGSTFLCPRIAVAVASYAAPRSRRSSWKQKFAIAPFLLLYELENPE